MLNYRIRAHDGSFFTLNEVMHVPLMIKNLILLTLLDSKGSKVLLEGIKRGTLYFLQGSIQVLLLLHRLKFTRMICLKWHMRLGHKYVVPLGPFPISFFLFFLLNTRWILYSDMSDMILGFSLVG